MVTALRAALLAIFVVGIGDGEKALGSIVVFSAEGHVLPTRFAIVDDVPDQIEAPAIGPENPIVIICRDWHHGIDGYRMAGSGMNCSQPNGVGVHAVFWNCWQGILTKDNDRGVTFCNRSGRYPAICDHKLYSSKFSNIPSVEANATHYEAGAERERYMPIGGFGGSGGGISGFDRGAYRSASITHLEKGYQSETACSYGEDRSGNKKQFSISDEIRSQFRRLPIQFDFVILALLLLWGGLGGYYFYYERNILSAAFFSVGLLEIALIFWLI
jgi:hypothetical protein